MWTTRSSASVLNVSSYADDVKVGDRLFHTGMEITGIASQFAMQSRPICDANGNMRRKHCDAYCHYFSSLHLVSDSVAIIQGTRVLHQRPGDNKTIGWEPCRLQRCTKSVECTAIIIQWIIVIQSGLLIFY